MCSWNIRIGHDPINLRLDLLKISLQSFRILELSVSIGLLHERLQQRFLF